MQIQILSDLHLEIERVGAPPGQEFYTCDIPVCAENLALLGDIGWTIQDGLFEWLRIQLKLFRVVFFLSGNHGACLARLPRVSRLISQTEPYRSTIVSCWSAAACISSLTQSVGRIRGSSAGFRGRSRSRCVHIWEVHISKQDALRPLPDTHRAGLHALDGAES